METKTLADELRPDGLSREEVKRWRETERLERQVLRMVHDGRMRLILQFLVDTAHAPGCPFNAPCRREALRILSFRAPRIKGKGWTEEDVRIAEEMLAQKKTVPQIALRLRVSRSAVTRAISKGRVRAPTGQRRLKERIPDEVVDQAIALHAEGTSWAKASRQVGCSASAVRRRLRQRAGILPAHGKKSAASEKESRSPAAR